MINNSFVDNSSTSTSLFGFSCNETVLVIHIVVIDFLLYGILTIWYIYNISFTVNIVNNNIYLYY